MSLSSETDLLQRGGLRLKRDTERNGDVGGDGGPALRRGEREMCHVAEFKNEGLISGQRRDLTDNLHARREKSAYGITAKIRSACREMVAGQLSLTGSDLHEF